METAEVSMEQLLQIIAQNELTMEKQQLAISQLNSILIDSKNELRFRRMENVIESVKNDLQQLLIKLNGNREAMIIPAYFDTISTITGIISNLESCEKDQYNSLLDKYLSKSEVLK